MQVRYLGTSQSRLGGSLACPVASVYVGLYLLYSSEPRAESIVATMRAACQDYQRSLADGSVAEGEYQYCIKPWRANPFVRPAMRIADDLECSGLMLARDDLYDRLPDAFRPGGPAMLLRGARPALERIAERVRSGGSDSALAFAFSRAGATIGGCVRRLGDGALRWDLVDSHEKIVRGHPPPAGESSSTSLDFRYLRAPPSVDASRPEHDPPILRCREKLLLGSRVVSPQNQRGERDAVLCAGAFVPPAYLLATDGGCVCALRPADYPLRSLARALRFDPLWSECDVRM